MKLKILTACDRLFVRYFVVIQAVLVFDTIPIALVILHFGTLVTLEKVFTRSVDIVDWQTPVLADQIVTTLRHTVTAIVTKLAELLLRTFLQPKNDDFQLFHFSGGSQIS